MIKLIGDMHMHTLASGHAYGTIREMAQAAAEIGLKIIGITEHGPGIPGTVDPFYFGNLKVVPRELCGVEVLHGCEVNVLNDGTLSLNDRFIRRLDYCSVGIHTLCYENAGKEKNTENLISCMQHPKIKFVTHPDDDHTPLDYERLTDAAKETNTALEINNSSLVKKEFRLNCYDNYRTILRLCHEKNVPVIVNSDAHDPSQVGMLDLAAELLESEGFPADLVLNADYDRLVHFLTE